MKQGYGMPRKPCPECGERFFTGVGLDERIRLGVHGNTNLVIRRAPKRSEPEPVVKVQPLAAPASGGRRACNDCDLVTLPAPLGTHQRFSGHVGWTEACP